MKKIAIALLYLAQAVYAYGTFTAQLEYESHNEYPSLGVHQRDDMGFIVFWSALPCGFVVAAVESNFNQHGWELTWREP